MSEGQPPFCAMLGGLGKSTTFPHRPGTPARRTPPSSRRIGSFQVRRRKTPAKVSSAVFSCHNKLNPPRRLVFRQAAHPLRKVPHDVFHLGFSQDRPQIRQAPSQWAHFPPNLAASGPETACPAAWGRRVGRLRLAEKGGPCELTYAQIVQSIYRERNRMMARTKRSRRSYGAGEWGRNRVRIFPDLKTGLFQIEWRENGRRLTRSLKHPDWRRAKRQADEFAAGFVGPEIGGEAEAKPEPLTLERLFDIYGEEVTPAKGTHTRRHDRTSMRMFLRFFGRNRDPATLSQRDWDRFIRERRAGRIGPSGKPVSDRTVEYDLKFLIAVLNWGAKSRDERGRLLLDRNPLKGLRTPSEKNPTRVVLAEEEYRALLKVSRRVDWRYPRRACARARDRPPHRCHTAASVVRHRLRGWDHRLARRARQVRLRTHHARDRRRTRRVEGGAGDEPRNRGGSGAARAQKPAGGCGCRSVARLVAEGPVSCRAGPDARQGLALAEAEVCFGPDGPAVEGALPAWRLEDGQDGPSVQCYQRADEGQLRKALEDRRRARD